MPEELLESDELVELFVVVVDLPPDLAQFVQVVQVAQSLDLSFSSAAKLVL